MCGLRSCVLGLLCVEMAVDLLSLSRVCFQLYVHLCALSYVVM